MQPKITFSLAAILLLFFFLNASSQNNITIEPDSSESERGFLETWDSASFSYQDWTVECDAWQIDTVEGNPVPCAMFSSDSTLYNYSCSLISKEFLMVGGGGINYGLRIGFDLELVDSTFSNTEKLVLIIDDYGYLFFSDTIVNDGDIPWKAYDYYFTEDGAGIGRIKFKVIGENSHNVHSWLIDNIQVEICSQPPVCFAAQKESINNYDIIHLDWRSGLR